MSFSLTPGIRATQERIIPNNRNSEYTIRVDVEFRHLGQALQQREHAAEPQQQARLAAQDAAEQTPITAPILNVEHENQTGYNFTLWPVSACESD